MALPRGFRDNSRPEASWNAVQNVSPDGIHLCVHGATPCSEDWLIAARAQLPAPHGLVLCGGSAGLAGHVDALRFADLEGLAPEALACAISKRLPNKHLLIVRSDAQLPPAALPRLLRALEEEDVLAAGPLDNLEALRSPVPDGVRCEENVARIDALCFAHARRQLIDLPSISPLASAWHGPRLANPDAPGLRRVVLDHLYVAASGRALAYAESPGDPRDPLPPSPLAELRAQLALALRCAAHPDLPAVDARPVILHVLHGWGGGAERWVRDFCASFNQAHHLVLKSCGSHARKCHGEWLELHDGGLNGPALQRLALPEPIADTALENAGYRRLLAELIARYSIDSVMVSSLIGHSLDALRTGLPTTRIVHDHYPLWPVLHRDFSDPQLRFDDAQRKADLAAPDNERIFANGNPDHWRALRDGTVSALLAAKARVIAPSRSALANDLRLAPELASLSSTVIAHGLDAWPANAARAAAPIAREKLRLVIPGRVRAGKGALLLEQVLPRVREHADIFLLGAGGDAHAFFGMDGVHILLDYRREELPALLARIAPDAAMLLPTVAETFGYMLSELRDLGWPVIATRMGAYAERIDEGVNGFLVAANADAIVDRVITLSGQRPLLHRVREHLATRREPGLEAMATAYAAVLDLPKQEPMRYALGTSTIDAQVRAAYSEDLQRAQRQRREQDAEILALRAESERRGEWGHAQNRELELARHQLTSLEKEVEVRTAWALKLDAEVKRLRPMLASRLWRRSEPLRTFLSRVRASLAFRSQRLIAQTRRVRGSLAQHGLGGTWSRVLRELKPAKPLRHARSYPAPDNTFSPFSVPCSDAPQVSIVIPVYNKIAYSAACLRSIAEHAGTSSFEVIVVDDQSSDETETRLAGIDGIRVLRNEENLGFVGSCNAGGALARGEFVLFLNNDTLVTAGWLEALLRVFAEVPDAGLVGSRLVYPDGRLQEAGGIIFSDGSGWNYGRFEDPDDTDFGFRREVDYCSGAAILLRRHLFEALGGFDTRYAPAYYEDTDLAFAVRARGLKVIYEPNSWVIHFEGITAGTDTASGMKRFQPINQQKFVDKWSSVLRSQPQPGTPIHLAASHRARRRILIIDAVTPAADHDAGSLRMVNLMRVLRDEGCQVTFMASNRAWVEGYTAALQESGIEVLHHPWHCEPVALFRKRAAEFDAIVLSRHYVAREFIGLARLYAPRARLIFDTVDLHYLRETRAAELQGRTDLLRHAQATRSEELSVMRDCDLTLVVSSSERELLAVDAPGVKVDVLALVHEVNSSKTPFADRKDLLFVGGFQHPPNIDAVVWFAESVLPRVRQRLPEVCLHVIGSKVTPAIQQLASDAIRVHGFIEDISPWLDGCRVSIAPIRYGAGVKGKVTMAMSCGLPVVATSIAVEGIHARDGFDIRVADSAEAFAEAVVELYEDEAQWNHIAQNALATMQDNFSFTAARRAIRRIFDL